MSRSGRVGLLCAFFLVLVPSAASAADHGPPPVVTNPNATYDGAEPTFISLVDQPLEFTGSDADPLVPVKVYEIDGTVPDHEGVEGLEADKDPVCQVDRADDPDWQCWIRSTFFLPGPHTFRVVMDYASLGLLNSWHDVTVTIGPSALHITSKELTSGSNVLTVSGTRDPGLAFPVEADLNPRIPTSSFGTMAVTTVPCLDPTDPDNDGYDADDNQADHFLCTYDFDDDLPDGTTIDVAVREIFSTDSLTSSASTLTPFQVTIGGPAPSVDPPGAGAGGGAAPATAGAIPVVPIPLAPLTVPPPPRSAPPVTAIPEDQPSSRTASAPAPASPDEGDALRLLLLAAIAFAILAMIGPHGLAYASDQARRLVDRGHGTPDAGPLLRGAPGAEPPGDNAIAAMTLAALAGHAGGKDAGDGTTHARRFGLSWGDRSWTWQLAGWKQTDRLSRRAPMSLARRLPLVARVGADANYLRALLGAAWLVLPAGGILLGIVAANRSGGLPIAPSTAITATLILLAILDAASGAAAVLAFTAVVLVRGGLTGEGFAGLDGLRGLLGLAALWFAIPLIAAAARPFRRLAEPGHVYRWDRLGDGVIAALVGGLAVYATVAGLGDLAGRPVDASAHAKLLGLVAVAAIVARVVIEEVIAIGYPARLRAVQPASPLSKPSRPHQLRGIIVRAGLLALFASAAIGNCWQLWVGVALHATPQVLTLVEHHLPNLTELHRRLPRGVVKFLLMLVVGVLLARVIDATYHDEPARALRDGFLLLACPGFLLAMMGIVGRESPAPPWTWPRQLAGAALVALAVVLVVILP